MHVWNLPRNQQIKKLDRILLSFCFTGTKLMDLIAETFKDFDEDINFFWHRMSYLPHFWASDY